MIYLALIVIGTIAIFMVWLSLRRDEGKVERAVQKRQELAIKKQIHEKATTIASVLGKRYEDKGYHGDLFSDGVLQIRTKWSQSSTNEAEYWGITVLEDNRKVFSTRGFVEYPYEIEAYAPGPWELRFESIYDNARTLKEQEDKKNVQAELEGRKRDFGL